MYYVYVVENERGCLYKGYTSNLIRRRVTHLLNWSLYSKKFGACRLVYFEHHSSKREALKREKFLKMGQGRLFLQRKLGTLVRLHGEVPKWLKGTVC